MCLYVSPFQHLAVHYSVTKRPPPPAKECDAARLVDLALATKQKTHTHHKNLNAVCAKIVALLPATTTGVTLTRRWSVLLVWHWHKPYILGRVGASAHHHGSRRVRCVA